ncbi:3'(2'), 5'-bisphosphate nucleotidase [Nematocida parisii]|uniref:3'(2'),5'-bisphosphate nucleotidase n=1 Tax=Nematocida parisii (strain ERTm3) TaxID=935791 RepID=I3EJI6_NEMP3|nr:uncharacterized protein NEPG_01087 [Nematocida parisii ERTm1]EIJ89383.1 hypothetical protein NEQG_00153 [Nematocida parisii ERTm3]KAI5127415.1 3'(2'), 5'-bisphosphate nucleotidase [Nematocida parisii]EIJ94419.1 hypothetical protein NEPG_01087 [Nematocida parisii ERTm1]KAI5131127.1 3'(2'), 5'-bisphosphate nucleotidase [Nematocida parisii]KAI5141342.1 3'(2'), 5'-bisphosphate nucleotidase [Nematocida parisii]|eukprot:XP_013058915.1 hypothetical protein NEPG_01087 [Nematocida parisii ERTm1]
MASSEALSHSKKLQNISEITNYQEIFKNSMKCVCYASHLTRNAPIINPSIKSDLSPVTVYDIIIQMIFCKFLDGFPVTIVTEEENNEYYNRIYTDIHNNTTEEYIYIREFLKQNKIVLNNTSRRVFTQSFISSDNITVILDPIDGTKGFINGRSYSTVVSCVKSDKVLFSIISCPKEGIIYYKCNMAGSDGLLLGYPHRKRVKTLYINKSFKPTYKRFIKSLSLRIGISAESDHSNSIQNEFISRISQVYTVHVKKLDGQSKYACVAVQKLDLFIRIPRTRITEKVWDHCAGIDMNDLSIVTDLYGIPITPCTPPVYGVIASHSSIFHNLSISLLKVLLKDFNL